MKHTGTAPAQPAQGNRAAAPYTPAEAAAKLRLSPWTIYRMLQNGELRGRRFRNVWRIPAREIDAFLEE